MDEQVTVADRADVRKTVMKLQKKLREIEGLEILTLLVIEV